MQRVGPKARARLTLDDQLSRGHAGYCGAEALKRFRVGLCAWVVVEVGFPKHRVGAG